MGLCDDPRPDLKSDTREWTRFLKLAAKINTDMAWLLNGFRCVGLRLQRVRDQHGNDQYALRPEYDPKSSKWATQAEYEKDRDKWLLPYKQEILELLNKI